MTQQQIEKILGLSRGYLSKVKHGKREPSQLLRVAVRLLVNATAHPACHCGGPMMAVPTCLSCMDSEMSAVEAEVFASTRRAER